MGEEAIAIALYDYIAQQKEELSIKKNEKLIIIDDSQTWWKVRNEQNLSGYVPSNYVGRKDPKKSVLKLKNIFGKGVTKKGQPESNGFDNERNQYCTPESVLVPTHKAICQVRAKFSYKPRNKDELELNKGALIYVLEKEHDGWWKGRSGTNQGWFPSNYAEEDTTSTTKLNFKVIALYPFSSSNDEELDFHKDEILDIIKQPEGDPDWWEARKSDGNIGLVPKNYVRALSENLAHGEATPETKPGKKLPLSPEDSKQAFQKVLLPSHKDLSFGNAKWFWGRISRENGEKLLGVHGDNGDFLVRESESQEGDYSVSMKAPDRIKHFRIKTLEGGFKIGQRTFISLDDLIEHYKKLPIFTNEKAEKMFLVKPVEL